MSTVVIPGSFDPITLGHEDIIRRAATIFENVIVCVVGNPNKQGTFTHPQRVQLITEILADLPNIEVDSYHGLLVDYCQHKNAVAVVKGVRDSTDLAYEQPMAHMNKSISPIDTIYLPCAPQYSFVSSSLCREVWACGGDVEHLLAPQVLTALNTLNHG